MNSFVGLHFLINYLHFIKLFFVSTSTYTSLSSLGPFCSQLLSLQIFVQKRWLPGGDFILSTAFPQSTAWSMTFLQVTEKKNPLLFFFSAQFTYSWVWHFKVSWLAHRPNAWRPQNQALLVKILAILWPSVVRNCGSGTVPSAAHWPLSHVRGSSNIVISSHHLFAQPGHM